MGGERRTNGSNPSVGWEDDDNNRGNDFFSKIGRCKHEISKWRKNLSPYGKEKIMELQKELDSAQRDDQTTQDEIWEITNRLKEAYRDEEFYWQQKSRTIWHTSGDRYTKFFFVLTKQKRARNRIVGLHDPEGKWVTKDSEVERVAVDYFTKIFETTNPTEFDSFVHEVPTVITEQMNTRLMAHATEEEIRKALFMMHPEKAPGPDGMTALFYQQSWNIVKKDLVILVNDFLTSGEFDRRLNTTNICLIPKTERPTRMTVKIVSELENWPAFEVYTEEYAKRKASFMTFELKQIPRTQNQTADRLARSARLRQSSSTHIGQEPPLWMIGN